MTQVMKRQKRSPGRPSSDAAIKERMLAVAMDEFSAHGFRGVSVTTIAKAVGATTAMIHYYFGNKQGLYDYVLVTYIVIKPFKSCLRVFFVNSQKFIIFL